MKRKILKIFKILTVLTILSATPASAATYSDVHPNSILQTYLDYLSDKSIISGYPDETFKPDQTINRAEALKIIFKTISPESPENPEAPEAPFPDVPTDAWFTPFIRSAKEQGIVNGYPDGSFKPAQDVNRAEFIKMAMRALPFYEKINGSTTETLKQYSDLNSKEWYIESVSKALLLDFLPQTSTLQLHKPMLRSDASEIIYKISKYLELHPSSLDPRPSTSFIPPESIISIDPLNIDNSPSIPKPAITYGDTIYEQVSGAQIRLEENSGLIESRTLSGQLSLSFNDGCFVDFLRYPFEGNIQHFYEENIEYGTDNMGVPEKEEFLELATHNGFKRYQHHLYWNFTEKFQQESGLKNHNQDDFFFTNEHALSLNAHSPWKTHEECKPRLKEVIEGLSKTSL